MSGDVHDQAYLRSISAKMKEVCKFVLNMFHHAELF